jgi:hypothetical protein
MDLPTIGKLERVALREVWKHEAIDFTQLIFAWFAQLLVTNLVTVPAFSRSRT